ncbi:MAG: methylmalonyl Co-A mutase-associated GTPase MeaB [bacterium]
MSAQNTLIENFLQGDRRALSKCISLIENEDANSTGLIDAIYAKIGAAYRIGITGPPGVGKSTLVDELTKYFRQQGKTVGIIAVDPTSPFTGGALLGDRVRMNDVTLDEGVFIRSMATRGSLGGLSQKADDAADILDAFGKDFIILETVGVGQSELDVVEVADTTLVVLVPESGDAIQAMKAGLMEIADLFIINKSDREGSERAVQEIQSILQLRTQKDWEPKVLRTVANKGVGIQEVADMVATHRNFLVKQKILIKKRQERLLKKIRAVVRLKLEETFWDESVRQSLQKHLENIDELKKSPYQIAEQLLMSFNRRIGEIP